MQSKILFLGTGGDPLVIGKQYRYSGGIILNIENSQFHLDPGPGALVSAKMMGVNLRESTAIFISKNDIFRANDINAVISAMTHEGLDKRGVLVCPWEVVSDEDRNMSPLLSKQYKKYLEKVIIVNNTRKLAINNIDIEVVELKDDINSACGYKFITPKFVIGYIPDTRYFAEIGILYKDCDIMIINVQEPRNTKTKEHINSEDAEEIIKKSRPQLVIITGFGIKMLQAEPLYEVRQIQKATGIQVIAAKDGMTINPVSFTTAVRQQRLDRF